EGVTLDAEGEAAEGIGFFLLGREPRKNGEAKSGDAGVEEAATVQTNMHGIHDAGSWVAGWRTCDWGNAPCEAWPAKRGDVSPEAAQLDTVAVGDVAAGGLLQAGLITEVVHLDGEIDAELAGLDAVLVLHVEVACGLVVGVLLVSCFGEELFCLALGFGGFQK